MIPFQTRRRNVAANALPAAHGYCSQRLHSYFDFFRGEFKRARLLTPAEMIIQSGTHDIVVLRDIIPRRDAATGAAIEIAKVDVKIFGLHRPIAG